MLLLAAGSSAGTAGALGTAPDDRASSEPLRVAAPESLRVGAAVDEAPLRADPEYARTLAREYDAVTPENAMKFERIHPERDRYDFVAADEIVDFAERNDMTVRGHTLVWYRDAPDWVTDGSWNERELRGILRDHIQTVVRRYRDTVTEWDVVNEALDRDGDLRDSVWTRVIGPEYVGLAFRWAHEADPDAALFYNDYDLELPGPKARAAARLVRRLQDRGVPIDGVGLQGHELTERRPSDAELDRALRRFTDLGVDVAITELDVGVFLPATRERLEDQADVYRDVLDACLDVRRCRSITTWGVTDRHSWVPDEVDGFGAALPFDEAYREKPAAAALRERLARGRD